MSTIRVIVVGAVTLALTILALTTPPQTTVRFIDLDLTIVVLFRIMAPLLFVGFLLEAVSNWAGRLVGGRLGKEIAGLARGIAPAFVLLVPAEVLYILLFVAFAVGVPNGWAVFQLLFSPGLIILPFIFNWRTFRSSVREAYNWLKPQYRKSLRRIKASQVPWAPLFVDTMHDFLPGLFWAVIGIVASYVIEPTLIQHLGIWPWIAIAVFFGILYVLKYFKWKYPIPPRPPNPSETQC
jgi:hypothetical protein